jgi:hypothetical protein
MSLVVLIDDERVVVVDIGKWDAPGGRSLIRDFVHAQGTSKYFNFLLCPS